MKKGNSKAFIIILCVIIGLSFLTMAGLVIWQTVTNLQGSDNDWYAIIFGPFIMFIIFLLVPLYVAIGYEGTDMSAFSPAGTYFWFWLALLISFGCVIALAIITSKRNKKHF